MGDLVHRVGDSRYCGALTIDATNERVSVEGKLAAVEGDPNDHLSGEFVDSQRRCTIMGKTIICKGDLGSGDQAGHSPTQTRAEGTCSRVSVAKG